MVLAPWAPPQNGCTRNEVHDLTRIVLQQRCSPPGQRSSEVRDGEIQPGAHTSNQTQWARERRPSPPRPAPASTRRSKPTMLHSATACCPRPASRARRRSSRCASSRRSALRKGGTSCKGSFERWAAAAPRSGRRPACRAPNGARSCTRTMGFDRNILEMRPLKRLLSSLTISEARTTLQSATSRGRALWMVPSRSARPWSSPTRSPRMRARPS